MTPPDDEAFLEFAADAPSDQDQTRPQDQTVGDDDARDSSVEHSPDAALRATADEDALIEFVPDTRAVPPPVQNEIDALVDAVSVGGRPRVASEPEVIHEADDSDLAEFISVPYEMPSSSSASIFHPAAARYVGGSVAAFAAGAFIAWSVLSNFDAQPVPVAVNQPTSIDAPRATTAPSTSPQVTAPVKPPDAQAVTPPTRPRPLPQPTVEVRPRVAEPRPAAIPRESSTAVVPRDNVTPPAANPTARAETANAPATPPIQPNVPNDAARIAALAPPPAVATAPPVITPPPVAAAPAPAAAALSAVIVEQKAVLDIVREYTDAYQAMDVTATAAVWPSVDRRALTRAFATLKSQALALEGCEVAIADKSATARCRGTVEYVRKVGNPTPRTGYQEWVFKMRKLGDDWIIDGVDASQSSTLSADARRRES